MIKDSHFFLETIAPLNPVAFFAFQMDCHKGEEEKLGKKNILPDLTPYYDASPFATVAMGWSERGISLAFTFKGSFDKPDFPNFTEADSIELFFDTRDVKTTGFITRFCHHFFFLPLPVQTNGDLIQAGEVTRFRTDDLHDLCDPNLLRVEKNARTVNIFIPAECLHGYDPTQFDRLGFTYRINRIDGFKQNFSASDADFSIESQPSLWASLKLIKTTS